MGADASLSSMFLFPSLFLSLQKSVKHFLKIVTSTHKALHSPLPLCLICFYRTNLPDKYLYLSICLLSFPPRKM